MIKTKKIYAKKDERQRQFKAENVQKKPSFQKNHL